MPQLGMQFVQMLKGIVAYLVEDFIGVMLWRDIVLVTVVLICGDEMIVNIRLDAQMTMVFMFLLSLSIIWILSNIPIINSLPPHSPAPPLRCSRTSTYPSSNHLLTKNKQLSPFSNTRLLLNSVRFVQLYLSLYFNDSCIL